MQNACSVPKPKTITYAVCATYWGKMHCIAWSLNYVVTITCKPHGLRSILRLTAGSWTLLCGLLKLKAASGMVFATCWNYHLHIAHTGMVFAVKFHELHFETKTCKLREACSCLKVTIGRCTQHLGARPLFRYFLPSCLFFYTNTFSFDTSARESRR